MTKNEAISKLLVWANAQIGTTESGDNWNKYAQNMAAAYGWNVQNQPWCDVFVDAGFVECFGLENAAKMTYQPIGGFSAACRYSAQYYKNNGAWYSAPEPGDQIFFYYDGDINHTGIVVSASGGVVRAIEGNSRDAVRSNAYGIGASNIAGYGRPNWSVVAGEDNNVPATDVNDTAPTVKLCSFQAKAPLLQMGDKGTFVRILQLLLLERGQKLPRYGADADFGGETQNAVERFQKENGLVVDSVVGEATWAKLFEV